MSNARASIGQATGGDTILISRDVYTQDLTPIQPTAAQAEISILDDQGNLVTTAPAQVTSVYSNNLPDWGGFASYRIDFSVTLPDTLEGTLEGLPYTAVMSFTLIHATGTAVLPDVQEAFVLTTGQDFDLGPQTCVLIPPFAADLVYNSLHPMSVHQVINLTLYHGNFVTASWANIYSAGSVQGTKFSFPLDTSNLRPSLMPYAALWTVKGNQEIAPIFVINPSINMAMRELSDYVNNTNAEWSVSLTFTPTQLVAALYHGACLFNAEAVVTDFDMTNALGTIRSFWIQYSAVWLLQSQVLNGIQTDFQYTNSSVTLDVDRSSKYQQFADSLASSLREMVRPMKVAMTKRGNISGDGSANPLTLRRGAIAAIGIALSPVSKAGMLVNPLSWRSAAMNPGATLGDMVPL